MHRAGVMNLSVHERPRTMSAQLGSGFHSSPVLRSAPRATHPRGWLETLRLILRVIRTRQDLAGMEPRMLRDIGLTPGQARHEAQRAPWDIGPHRG